jgi:hypothetical protein
MPADAIARRRCYDEQHFIERTQALLQGHWPAVEALAQALVRDRRIDGERVQRIIDRAM